jgi:hypothetical protein
LAQALGSTPLHAVIDIRDLYFYLCLVGVFLSLNVFELERQRWSGNAPNSRHRQWGIVTVLLVVNFLRQFLDGAGKQRSG